MNIDVPVLGTPHIPISMACVRAIGSDPDLDPSLRDRLAEWWKTVVLEGDEAMYATRVKVWKIRKAPKQEKRPKFPKGFARLVFVLDSEELESILVAALPSLGAERKLGTAPRSGQEREVQRLLDRLKD